MGELSPNEDGFRIPSQLSEDMLKKASETRHKGRNDFDDVPTIQSRDVQEKHPIAEWHRAEECFKEWQGDRPLAEGWRVASAVPDESVTFRSPDGDFTYEVHDGRWCALPDAPIFVDAGRKTSMPQIVAVGDFDFRDIPTTEWLYGRFYARGYTSLTVAPPKVGKSQLALAEAMDMASGGKVFGVNVEPRRALYLNAEDDQTVLHSRYAAICKKYGIKHEDFEGRLFLQSTVEWPDLFLLGEVARDLAVNDKVFTYMARVVGANEIDLITMDPLQDMSHADESNQAFRLLGQRLRRFASENSVAIHLIHHTRKMQQGTQPTIDDARGGSALRGTSRFNRILVGMSEAEGLKAGVTDHRYYFRIGEIESNLAPPSSEHNQWFEKVSVKLPNGESVVALSKWKWPDAFEGITLEMAAEAVRKLQDMKPSQSRAHSQAAQWFGYVVARICGIDLPQDKKSAEFKAGRSKVEQILNQWVQNEWLQVERFKDDVDRKEKDCYRVGTVDPKS